MRAAQRRVLAGALPRERTTRAPAMSRKMTVVEAGRRGGLKGGRSTSPAKRDAARKNIAKAREKKLAELAASPSLLRVGKKLVLPDGRIVSRQYKHQLDNPQMHGARAAVRYALKTGRLQKQPCIECGNERSQAHHLDYSRPLDVVWLCQRHHKKVHREMKISLDSKKAVC